MYHNLVVEGIDDDDTKDRDLLQTLKSFFLPDPGHEKNYLIGIAIDVVAIVTWLILVLTLVPNSFFRQYWFMPLVGKF